MDERKNIRIRTGFPQKVDKEKWKLFTMEKDRESEKVERVDVEENKVFQNLSTSYQQIVDNVKNTRVNYGERNIDREKKARYNAIVMRCIF